MSKFDSSLSKDQFNLLKQFKKQISNPNPRVEAPAPVVKTPEQEQEEDLELFRKQMQGVKIDNGNSIAIEKPRKKSLMHRHLPNVLLLKVRCRLTKPPFLIPRPC